MRIAILVVLGSTALGLVGSPFASAAPGQLQQARVAGTLNGNDNASLHLVRANGSTFSEEGHASGGLPGIMRAWLHVGATFTGRFVFYTRAGELFGNGKAKPHRGKYPWESFAGTLSITGGTGRYRHAHGSGSLYGAFNRKNSEVDVQTRGRLYY